MSFFRQVKLLVRATPPIKSHRSLTHDVRPPFITSSEKVGLAVQGISFTGLVGLIAYVLNHNDKNMLHPQKTIEKSLNKLDSRIDKLGESNTFLAQEFRQALSNLNDVCARVSADIAIIKAVGYKDTSTRVDVD